MSLPSWGYEPLPLLLGGNSLKEVKQFLKEDGELVSHVLQNK